jgi:hypothetical protein
MKDIRREINRRTAAAPGFPTASGRATVPAGLQVGV